MFPIIIGVLSQVGGANYDIILSFPIATQTSDTTAIIGITVNLTNYEE